jgi:hypothetical protein
MQPAFSAIHAYLVGFGGGLPSPKFSFWLLSATNVADS